MIDRPKITLPLDFELFRNPSFESRLPRKHVGFYIAAKKYAALKNSDGSYVSTVDGSPSNDKFAFDNILAPMGPSISISGGADWSEDVHGSIFDSNSSQTSLRPSAVGFSINYMGNESVIATVDGIRSGSIGSSYGSYIPEDILLKIEEWVSKSDFYKNELRSRLDSENGDQISQAAKEMYESAASYRAAAAELLSFATLRAKQLAYKKVTCGPREILDFGSGRCILARAKTDPRTSLSISPITGSSGTRGDGTPVGGSSSGSGSGSGSSGYGDGPFVGGSSPIIEDIEITNEDYEQPEQKKKSKAKKKSGGSGLLIAGAAVLGLLAFGGKK